MYLDDADYVGSVIDLTAARMGSAWTGAITRGLTVKTLGSSLEFRIAIGETESNYADCTALMTT